MEWAPTQRPFSVSYTMSELRDNTEMNGNQMNCYSTALAQSSTAQGTNSMNSVAFMNGVALTSNHFSRMSPAVLLCCTNSVRTGFFSRDANAKLQNSVNSIPYVFDTLLLFAKQL